MQLVKFFLIGLMAFFPAWNPCHAGWILGSDSDHHGILKVFKADDGSVVIQRCLEDKDECAELARHQSVAFDRMANIAQVAGAGLVRGGVGIAGGAVLVHMWRWRGGFLRLVMDSALLTALLYGFSVPVLDMLDFERLLNYNRIYQDDFLTDDSEVIVITQDTIEEILEELD